MSIEMIIASVVCYFKVFVYESSKATAQLGVVCNFFTIIFFATPLATMVRMIATTEMIEDTSFNQDTIHGPIVYILRIRKLLLK